MGRSSKSKRFIKHAADAVQKHAERIPYHMTYAEAEARKLRNESSPLEGWE